MRCKTPLPSTRSSELSLGRSALVDACRARGAAAAAQLACLASVPESAFWEGIALDGLEELRLRGLAPFLDRKTRTMRW